jgi:hypothetical protein
VESRHRLEAQIRTRLEETYASAERALEIARSRSVAGEAAVRRELERIESSRRNIASVAGVPKHA